MTQRMTQEEVPRIPVDEAMRKYDRGEAIIVDVRQKAAYDEARVKGAIHMPGNEFPRHYQTLPRDKEIITY